ncbi:zinc finger protein 436-like [Frankliniella occidentalis]|uniref:Zinc finger protein 436-like n=1 Tax=Frankliniella occidentalis TaxID=133901 RepID=A0A6J1RVV3_FRAOC|nr:zinc finger protein 436-like [Frankliniella occidentalis]
MSLNVKMSTHLVYEKAKVAISKSFLDKMPSSIDKVQFFKESFENLELTVTPESEYSSISLEGFWDCVVKAENVLLTSLEKWCTSESKNKEINVPCLQQEVSLEENEGRLLEADKRNETDQLLEGSSVQLKREKRLSPELGSVDGSLDVLNCQVSDQPIENEVYMDIKLEHNYNHLEGLNHHETRSEICESAVENEIYMDIKLSKPNDKIFNDPDLPVTLVVATEDEPGIEVLHLKMNKTNKQSFTKKRNSTLESMSGNNLERKKLLKKKYEELAPFRYFCNQCSFKTKRHSHMRNHSRLHEKVCTIYSCDQCDFSTIRASHLQRHIGTHKTEIFACSQCTYSTHTEELLTKHQRYKHVLKQLEDSSSKDSYQCLQCDYMTTSEKHFQRHMAVHSKKGKEKLPCFKCAHCSYQTPSRSNYYRHLGGVHGDERPYMCTICGLCFKRSDTLIQHQATHADQDSDVKAYPCPQCKKNYRSTNALKEHQLTHEEERRYLCEICAASFKTRAIQRKHYNQKHVHTKTNPCASCSKSFTSKYLLKRHMKVHAMARARTSQAENDKNTLEVPTVGEGWCNSLVSAEPTSDDVQVIVVHQESAQSGLSVQEGPLFQISSSLLPGQAVSVPVVPVEYVITSTDSTNDNCSMRHTVDMNCAAQHIASSDGDIISLTFVPNDSAFIQPNSEL